MLLTLIPKTELYPLGLTYKKNYFIIGTIILHQINKPLFKE